MQRRGDLKLTATLVADIAALRLSGNLQWALR
jgi:hypothetical protein